MNSKTIWVLPSIDKHRGYACWETLHPDVACRTILIPNYDHNIGVPASWNFGVRRVLQDPDAEWLVLLSEAIRFGTPGGEDFEDQLAGAWTDGLFGWHLIGFHRDTLQRVGLFDEMFSPGYFEDTDLLYRMHLAGLPSPRENDLPGATRNVAVEAADLGTEHSLTSGLVTVNLAAQADKYRTKWGGDQGAERFTRPYDNPGMDWRSVTTREHR